MKILLTSNLMVPLKVLKIQKTLVISLYWHTLTEKVICTEIYPSKDIKQLLPPGANSKQGHNNDWRVNTAKTYIVSSATSRAKGALIDRGANGRIARDDVHVIVRTERQMNIHGIDNHRKTDIVIVTAGGFVNTQKGPVFAVLY